MPSLKEIKGRIASVNSTRKITSAMKMVASSKLHHAQVAIQNMLPYETLLEHILKSFLAAEAEAQTIYDQERPVKRVALVVFSSNSSLCGGFNANIIKMMTNAVDALSAELGQENVEVYPIGRKVAEKASKLGYQTGTATNIAQSNDVNETGVVDINDAQFVYNIYNGTAPTTNVVQRLLLADVNRDKTVNVSDCAAVVAAIG